jgi:hypothetical protein
MAHAFQRSVAALTLLLAANLAHAALPPPTPAEAAAQATKKAAADAQAAKDKEALLASIDTVSTRWRMTAKARGLAVNPPTPLPSPSAALSAPAKQDNAPPPPVTSEKSGSAAPSKDTKTAPSPPASNVKTVK